MAPDVDGIVAVATNGTPDVLWESLFALPRYMYAAEELRGDRGTLRLAPVNYIMIICQSAE